LNSEGETMTRRVCLLLAAPLVLLFARAAVADGPRQIAADERRLQAVNLKHDGPALLKFFRQRSLTDLERANVELLIQRLGARAFREREQASADLIARGPVVVEPLKEHLKGADLEIARRAEKCIERIKEKDVPADVSAAAARLLADRKPAGAPRSCSLTFPTPTTRRSPRRPAAPSPTSPCATASRIRPWWTPWPTATRYAAGPPVRPWPGPTSRGKSPRSRVCSRMPTRRCASAWRWP
jgi:hypothetical protein